MEIYFDKKQKTWMAQESSLVVPFRFFEAPTNENRYTAVFSEKEQDGETVLPFVTIGRTGGDCFTGAFHEPTLSKHEKFDDEMESTPLAMPHKGMELLMKNIKNFVLKSTPSTTQAFQYSLI